MAMMEDVAMADELALHIRAIMLGPNVDLKKYSAVMQEIGEDIKSIREYRRYALYHAQEAAERRAMEGELMWKAFERMEKDGTMEAFRKRAEALEAKVHANDNIVT